MPRVTIRSLYARTSNAVTSTDAQNETVGENNRRQFLQRSFWLSTFLIGGQLVRATPSEAKQRQFTPRVLTATQVQALETLADALVPGAAAAGIAPYIDDQLDRGEASLLMLKYLGVPLPEQQPFYKSALSAIAQALSHTRYSHVEALINAMGSDSVDNWQAPPASFVLFVLRADGLDVTYGTPSGFADLGIPYNAHIEPIQLW